MVRWLPARLLSVSLPMLFLCLPSGAQQEKHGRGYKPPPPTATVVISVEKADGKPLPNAAVIFHAVREDADDGNLEMKTDPDGRASIDLLDVGSHVTVQVLASGFASYATDFNLPPDGKQLSVKLQRPRAQVSMYGDYVDKPAQIQPGVQEHRPDAGKPYTAPTAAPPPPSSSTAPLQTTPLVNPPAATPAPSTKPTVPGSPQ